MSLTPRILALAVMYAIAYQQHGWRSRLLAPRLSLQQGLVLAWTE